MNDNAEERNKGGRPRLYDSPEAMQEVIDEYFTVHLQSTEPPKPPTVSGLCYYLGFDDRGALAEYEKRPEFSRTIKRVRARIEEYLETALHGNNVTGVIFNLKNNFGWKDKSEKEVSGPDGGPIKTEGRIVFEPFGKS